MTRRKQTKTNLKKRKFELKNKMKAKQLIYCRDR